MVVRRDAVEIDGVLHALVSDPEWRLSGARVRDDLSYPVLELTAKRTRRQSNGSQRTEERVVRVPVPRGREADARRIAEELGAVPAQGDDDG